MCISTPPPPAQSAQSAAFVHPTPLTNTHRPRNPLALRTPRCPPFRPAPPPAPRRPRRSPRLHAPSAALHPDDPHPPSGHGEQLVTAASRGDYPAVQRLLAAGAPPSTASVRGGMTALMMGAAEGHLEIVRLLLDAGADVNARTPQGTSALLYAVENLRSANPRNAPPPGFPGRDMFAPTPADTPQQIPVYAKKTPHPEIIRLLVDAGADIRIRNEVDETLLHIAARRAQNGIVREFLARGLDVNAKCMGAQETPLHIAARESHLDTVNLLCEVGADMEAKNRFGWTPLLWAAASGWASVVECLINRGADVNVQASYNADVTTPLKEARRCSRPVSICDMLIRAGARE